MGLLNCRWGSERRIPEPQSAQCGVEPRLRGESGRASAAIGDVTQASLSIAGIHNLAANKFYNYLFKVFTVHTRHPAGLMR
jgi:hypothetical protein